VDFLAIGGGMVAIVAIGGGIVAIVARADMQNFQLGSAYQPLF
jgi:hypothetical protein